MQCLQASVAFVLFSSYHVSREKLSISGVEVEGGVRMLLPLVRFGGGHCFFVQNLWLKQCLLYIS